MNGNPNAAQKRYHDELREWYFETQMQHGVGELHHIFGSKEKFKLLKEAGIEKAGEWFVIMLPKTVHDDIKSYSFEGERALFFGQKLDYKYFFGKESPIPREVFDYYTQMTSKHQGLKNWL